MRSVERVCLLILLVLAAGCGQLGDDLWPSGSDERPATEGGTTGPAVGQNAPDFTLSDSLGQSVSLSAALESARAVVLYFTMWCPVCDSHMSDMQRTIERFPDVAFYAVDYVSGSVAGARSSQLGNGFGDFPVLVDPDAAVLGAYDATMAITVVIDAVGVIRMNEDYKDGSRLEAVLTALP